MFGSEILDVAIGLILVYLLLSLFATAVREAVETVVKARAVHLERGIRELLDDPRGEGLARQFYEHPLIYSLFQKAYTPKETRRLGGNMPTYIPSRNFAVALLDLALRGPATVPSAATKGGTRKGHDKEEGSDRKQEAMAWPYAAQQTSPAFREADLRAAVARIPSVRVQRALLTAIDGTRGDLARVQSNLEDWFDSAMDRVSGWYKRRTQYGLFLIGLAVTIGLNVNTITIANHLARNKAIREALVEHARQLGQDTALRGAVRDPSVKVPDVERRLRELEALDLPIGWGRDTTAREAGRRAGTGVSRWIVQALGLLLTALAITLGAPFWFDALNKMMVIRSTVKPKEKSPEEASEDRQKPERTLSASTTPAPSTSMSASPIATAGATGSLAPNANAAAVTLMSASSASATADPDFVSQRWAVGDADEGLL